MNFCSKVILFLIICINGENLSSLTVGSRTAVSVQAQTTFPSAAENVMLGFAVFNQGFILTDEATTCTFDDYFPVSGKVRLNGGTLILRQDLVLSNTLDFYGSGNIIAQEHSIEFPSMSDFNFPTDTTGPIIFNDAWLSCKSNTNFLAPLQFKGTCKIDGGGMRLSFVSMGELIVRPESNLILENIEIMNLSQSKLRNLTDSGSITIRNSILHLEDYYTFSIGSVRIEGDCLITGSGGFFYTSCATSTITSKSALMLSEDVTFHYAPACASKNLIFYEDSTAALYLDGCSIVSTSTGMQLTGGTLIIDNHVTLSSQALNPAESLVLGSDLDVRVRSGAILDLHGYVRYES